MRFFKIAKNGFLILWEIKKAERKQTSYKIVGPKINHLLSDLGPTFIKLGQMLSLRADLINSDLADELRQLLDHGSIVEEGDINYLIKSELGKPPEEIFDSFERQPFAVASLSQVHLAHYQGKLLAVKIQKPGIKTTIHRDLSLVKKLLILAQLFSFSRANKNTIHLLQISVNEFFKWIEHELDYRLEALNIIRIKNNFSAIKFFEAPNVIHALSTKLVLTIEYIKGTSLNTLIDHVSDLPNTKLIKYGDINCAKKVFLKEILDIVFKQVFQDGYFHADPHPANILLTPQNHIAFIDFGVVGILQPRLKEIAMKILSGVIERDIKKISENLISLNEIEKNISIPEVEKKIKFILDDWQTGSVVEMTMAEVFYRLLLAAQESGIEVPLPIFVLGKTVLEYDGLLRKFDPEMDILNSLKEYVGQDSLLDLKNIQVSIKELLNNPENLPDAVLKIVKQLNEEGVEFISHLINTASAHK